VIASVSITLLILGIIAAIVVPVTCSVHGCPPKKQEVGGQTDALIEFAIAAIDRKYYL
jgi:hypothetical protein